LQTSFVEERKPDRREGSVATTNANSQAIVEREAISKTASTSQLDHEIISDTWRGRRSKWAHREPCKTRALR